MERNPVQERVVVDGTGMRGAAAKCIPVELDRWGYGRPVDGLLHEGRRSLAQARRAARACPNGAISFTVEEMARTT